ncbi:hypothetical protein [Vibrio comitans]
MSEYQDHAESLGLDPNISPGDLIAYIHKPDVLRPKANSCYLCKWLNCELAEPSDELDSYRIKLTFKIKHQRIFEYPPIPIIRRIDPSEYADWSIVLEVPLGTLSAPEKEASPLLYALASDRLLNMLGDLSKQSDNLEASYKTVFSELKKHLIERNEELLTLEHDKNNNPSIFKATINEWPDYFAPYLGHRILQPVIVEEFKENEVDADKALVKLKSLMWPQKPMIISVFSYEKGFDIYKENVGKTILLDWKDGNFYEY